MFFRNSNQDAFPWFAYRGNYFLLSEQVQVKDISQISRNN